MIRDVLQAAQKALQKYATHPIYDSAQILSGPAADRVEILLTSSARDLKRHARLKVATYKSFRRATPHLDASEWSSETNADNIASAAHEHVERQRIVFRSCAGKGGADDKRRFVERWSTSRLLDSIEVTSRHGDFYMDDTFGQVSFHQTKHSRIAYVAEARKPKDESHTKWKQEEDWGSTLEKKSNPVVVVLDFEGGLEEQMIDEETKNGDEDKKKDKEDETKGKVVVLSPPKDVCCSRPIFAHEDGKIVWTGYKTSPRRYGIFYCFNREASIMHSSYNGDDCRNLTQNLGHARAPRLGTDGSIYFLTNATGGPHFPCAQLGRCTAGKSTATIISTPNELPLDGGFAGIYSSHFHMHKDTIILATSVQSTTRVFALDVSSNATEVVPRDLVTTANSQHESWGLLGINKGQAVLSKTTPEGEIELRHYLIDAQASSDSANPVSFVHVEAPIPNAIDTRILTYPNKPTLQSILQLPKAAITPFSVTGSSKPPVLVLPHGGPHAATDTGFRAQTAALLQLGIAILHVNYTGSVGFGKASVETLNGHAGEVDVADVLHARNELVESGLVDPKRVGIFGGSHGGYLGAYLSGAYPDAFTLSVLLNPVIDLTTVGAGSDIPDWGAAVSGRPYELANPAVTTPEHLARAWQASPMRVVGGVKGPVYMGLGGSDRRVPCYEGLNWVRALRGRGFVQGRGEDKSEGEVKGEGEVGAARDRKVVRCYMFPEDGHSLDGGEAFKFGFEAMVEFLGEYL